GLEVGTDVAGVVAGVEGEFAQALVGVFVVARLVGLEEGVALGRRHVGGEGEPADANETGQGQAQGPESPLPLHVLRPPWVEERMCSKHRLMLLYRRDGVAGGLPGDEDRRRAAWGRRRRGDPLRGRGACPR